jgi:hypothetical protein
VVEEVGEQAATPSETTDSAESNPDFIIVPRCQRPFRIGR